MPTPRRGTSDTRSAAWDGAGRAAGGFSIVELPREPSRSLDKFAGVQLDLDDVFQSLADGEVGARDARLAPPRADLREDFAGDGFLDLDEVEEARAVGDNQFDDGFPAL